MPIPDFSQVLGLQFNTEIVEDLRDDEGNKLDGLCDFQTRTIYIDKHAPNKEQVYLHELGHAVFERASLTQHHDWCTKLEELLVDIPAKVISENFILIPKFANSLKLDENKDETNPRK